MCMVCDGFSFEEIDRQIDLTIQVNGFFIQQVGDGFDDPNLWSYTIGINESWDHADFVTVDMSADLQRDLIAALVDDVVDFGEVLVETLRLLDVELVPVHRSHLAEGMVAMWEVRNERRAEPGDFLQIVLGSTWYCAKHSTTGRRLDRSRGTAPRFVLHGISVTLMQWPT